MRKILNRKGQGFVEYLLIVGLIALLIYAAVMAFGKQIETGFKSATTKVSEATTW
jgi:Flp pilus assembly pilin Flp